MISTTEVGQHNGVFLGLAYNSPPPPRAVKLFHQSMFPVSTPELPELPRPAIVVGSKPCERIASAVSAQDDVVYVAVVSDPAEVAGSEHWVDDIVLRPEDYHDICRAGERALARKRQGCHAPKAIVSDVAFAWLGQSVELSPLQARIVQRLVEAQGAVVSEREMAHLLWGQYIDDPGRAIEAHIYRLRKRLDHMAGVRLETIRQRGYQLLLSQPGRTTHWDLGATS